MKCCGVEIKGSEAILVVVEFADDQALSVDTSACTKISLKDSADQNSVRSFSNAISAFANNHNVSHFAVRARNQKGEYAGGAVTFKMEGLFQILENVEVTIIHPTAIAAWKRKNGTDLPEKLLKYREQAFYAASYLMSK